MGEPYLSQYILKVMKSLNLKILIFVAIFLGLIFYNYSVAQNKLKSTKPTAFSLNILSPLSTIKSGTPTSFVWSVDAPNSYSTNLTTIYYGNTSSPSALTKLSSPEAVGYPHKTTDYLTGKFYLPNTFRTNITFTKPERVWYRGYAKVGDDHLWSEEKYIDITP